MSTDIALVREEAFASWKQLTIALGVRNKSYALIGASLKKIKNEELWKHLGETGYKSWSGFLSDPDIGMSVKTAYNYIFFYEEIVERLGYSIDETERISYTRLLPFQSTLRELPVDIAKGKVEQLNSLTLPDYEKHELSLKRLKKGKKWYFMDGKTKRLTIQLLTEDVDAIYIDGEQIWKNNPQ